MTNKIPLDFQKLVENLPDVVWKMGPEGEIYYVSPNIKTILGYEADDLLSGKIKWREFIHPDDVDQLNYEYDRIFLEDIPYDFTYRMYHKDGTMHWMRDKSTRAYKDGENFVAEGILSDITSQKLVELDLREKEARFEIAENLMKVGSWEYNKLTHKLKISNSYYRILEVPENTAPQLDLINDTVHPDDKNQVSKYMSRLNEETVLKPINFKIITQKGNVRLMYGQSTAILDEWGQIYKLIGVGQDVTDLRKTERELKEQRDKAQKYLEMAGVMFVILDVQGNVTLINKKGCEILGCTENEILGKNWFSTILPEEKAVMLAQAFDGFLTGEYSDLIYNENEIMTKSGQNKLIAWHNVRLTDEEGKTIGSLSAGEDITDRKNAESERLKAQKLEVTSLIAGGIAHDFNNILVGILGNVNIMQTFEKLTPDMEGSLKDIEIAALRASDLTKQLLTFSKGGYPIKKMESLENVITESCSFIMHGKKSKVDLIISPNLPPVEIDAGQINQVLNNLLINADQAMPNGGIITVKADKVESENISIPLPKGIYNLISIQDVGLGIPQEIQKKIFEPYFTTKPKGSGLGLATCYSIIKRHSGHIEFDSTPGVGSTFKIYLPISTKSYEQTKFERTSGKQKFKGRVLVMDDDHVVQKALSRMLRHLGFSVVSCFSGEDAIRNYFDAKKTDNPFTCIIMDLTVPGAMGGGEAMKLIKERDPEVKAFVASGYSNDPIISEYSKYGFSGVLHKPFSLDDLKSLFSDFLN